MPPVETNRLRSANFLNLTAADFIARTAYQMGKTPLLPLFAAALGASDAFLGVIVSVSTLTGMILKPLIGALSDRWGRRLWLVVGTLFFSAVPFFYVWVDTPQKLFVIRIVHGTATAIYGPVTLALIAEQFSGRRAEGFGWFGIARSGGYIVGPALAGWLLLTMSPERVFTLIGALSIVAFVPILRLQVNEAPHDARGRPSLPAQLRQALRSGVQTSALWFAGGMESITYVALYALKAFLPIYALRIGMDVAGVGFFFAVQEGVLVIARPFAGRLADRWGYGAVIPPGMTLIAVALFLIGVLPSAMLLFGVALLIGLGQALIFPATTALIAVMIEPEHVGAGMGFLGTLKNTGKVIGPVLGGLLLTRMSYPTLFVALSLFMLTSAVAIRFLLSWTQRGKIAPAASQR